MSGFSISWIDVVVISIIALSALISLFRGFTKEFISLAAWAVGIWLAVSYSEHVAVWLPASLDHTSFSLGEMQFSLTNLRVGIAFALLLVLTLAIGSIVNHLIGYLIIHRSLSLTDRTMGLLFGFARGYLIVVILVMIAGLTRLPQTAWWHDARLLQPFQQTALWVIGYLPGKYEGYFSFD